MLTHSLLPHLPWNFRGSTLAAFAKPSLQPCRQAANRKIYANTLLLYTSATSIVAGTSRRSKQRPYCREWEAMPMLALLVLPRMCWQTGVCSTHQGYAWEHSQTFLLFLRVGTEARSPHKLRSTSSTSSTVQHAMEGKTIQLGLFQPKL